MDEITSVNVNSVDYSIDTDIDIVQGQNTIAISNSSGCSWDTSFTISQKDWGLLIPDDIEFLEKGKELEIEAIEQELENRTFEWTSLTSTMKCISPSCHRIRYIADISETLYLTGTTDDGCTITDSIIIIVDPSSVPTDTIIDTQDLYYLPNIINLENSIQSDLCIHLTDRVEATSSLTLYDRWGNKVAQLHNPSSERQQCIDSSEDIQAFNPGVYIYHLQLTLINGSTFTDYGDITIIK